MTALLRELRCDIVLTASPDDYLCDHEATSALVRDACFAGSVKNYGTADGGSAPLLSIPALYFLDPIGHHGRSGRPVVPDFTVDVSPTFEVKRLMLAAA